MKKILYFFPLFLFVAINTYGQGVGIGTSNPDPSAKLEVNSSTQGTLITRMTTTQRNAINSPAIGLMIFNKFSKYHRIFLKILSCSIKRSLRNVSIKIRRTLGDNNIKVK